MTGAWDTKSSSASVRPSKPRPSTCGRAGGRCGAGLGQGRAAPPPTHLGVGRRARVGQPREVCAQVRRRARRCQVREGDAEEHDRVDGQLDVRRGEVPRAREARRDVRSERREVVCAQVVAGWTTRGQRRAARCKPRSPPISSLDSPRRSHTSLKSVARDFGGTRSRGTCREGSSRARVSSPTAPPHRIPLLNVMCGNSRPDKP